MPTATETCACPVCACSLISEQAVTKNGQRFCSTECAEGHPNDKGCGHSGCSCA